VAVAWLLDGYQLAVARQVGQNMTEGGPDCIAPAVQQQERRARRVRGAVDLVIDLRPLTGA
jgi:hypothetical protein